MFEVYCATSPSGKHYVGYTSRGAEARWVEHVQEAAAGCPLPFRRAIRKYGAGAFQRRLLERMTTEAGAHRAERLWIKELGAFGPRGYNATAGGEGMLGLVHSVEAREKMSRARVGRTSPMRGKTQSVEARAKISAANLGRPSPRGMAGRKHTAETLERLRQANAGHAPSAEAHEKARLANTGRKASAATRAKMSATHVRLAADRKNKPQ